MDDIFFTVVDEENGSEQQVNFFPDPDGCLVQFPVNAVKIDKQQLGELGSLLLALSCGEYDQESVDELMDGFGLSVPENGH